MTIQFESDSVALEDYESQQLYDICKAVSEESPVVRSFSQTHEKLCEKAEKLREAYRQLLTN